MLQQMTHEDLLKLTSVQEGPCISLYLSSLPSHLLEMDYESLLRRAAHLYSYDKSVGSALANSMGFMRPLYNFNPCEHLSPSHPGLAIFVNKHWQGFYSAPHAVPSKVVVSESFHLKPLLADLQGDHAYHALVLTADEALLIHGHNQVGSELHTFLFHHGSSSDSIHWKYLDQSEDFQIRHLKNSTRSRGLIDGHAKKRSDNKLFFRWIESKIKQEPGFQSWPLLIFSNETLFQSYREITSHPRPELCLVDTKKGLPRTDAVIHRAQESIRKQVQAHKNLTTLDAQIAWRKEKILEDLLKISKAALGGKVKTLFLRENVEIWGQLHRKSGQITFHKKQQDSKDDDILDDIACEVIRRGGEVIVLNGKDMPTAAPAVAVLNH